MNDCIGFFDSGVGGVSVMRTARRLLPNENFFYFGDNGNAPTVRARFPRFTRCAMRHSGKYSIAT